MNPADGKVVPVGFLKDLLMWGAFLATLVVMTAAIWPVFVAVNIRRIARREIMLSLAVVFLALDQLLKQLVIAKMQVADTIPLLRNLVHITYVQNRGAAFGLFQNKLALFITVAILSVGVIIYYSRVLAPGNRWVQVALGFLLAGAVGNMIDRVAFGYVIDFIDLRFWPVFNLADIVINVGVGMLLVEMFWEGRGDEESGEGDPSAA